MPTTPSRRSTRDRKRVSAHNNAMQRFEYLPRSTQIRRMRRLAQTALTAYKLEQVCITPLHHFLNTTFRIDIPSHQQRYVLRISRAGYQDAATIRSELLWLQAIR